MPRFHANRFSFDIPREWEDKTLYVFTVKGEQGPNEDEAPTEMSVVISRDAPRHGDALLRYLDEQLDEFRGAVKRFRIDGRDTRVELEVAGKQALSTEFTWHANEGPMHQIQVYLPGDDELLTFTATSLGKVRDDLRDEFMGIFETLELDDE